MELVLVPVVRIGNQDRRHTDRRELRHHGPSRPGDGKVRLGQEIWKLAREVKDPGIPAILAVSLLHDIFIGIPGNVDPGNSVDQVADGREGFQDRPVDAVGSLAAPHHQDRPAARRRDASGSPRFQATPGRPENRESHGIARDGNGRPSPPRSAQEIPGPDVGAGHGVGPPGAEADHLPRRGVLLQEDQGNAFATGRDDSGQARVSPEGKEGIGAVPADLAADLGLGLQALGGEPQEGQRRWARRRKIEPPEGHALQGSGKDPVLDGPPGPEKNHIQSREQFPGALHHRKARVDVAPGPSSGQEKSAQGPRRRRKGLGCPPDLRA